MRHRAFTPPRSSLACLLLGFCFVSTQTQAQTQPQANYCDPSKEVKQQLQRLPDEWDGSMPYQQAKERKVAQLRELLKKYPKDIFVHRRYQQAQEAVTRETESLVEEYRALLEKNPNDPVFQYLYAKLLIGVNTKEAEALLQKAAQVSPNFARVYLGLMEVYESRPMRDKAKAEENLKRYMAMCPDSLVSYNYLQQLSDKDYARKSMQRLREILEKSDDPQDLPNYSTLWRLEFSLSPVIEHDKVRASVAADLKRLRALNLTNNRQWLQTLGDGYKKANDKEGATWAEEQQIANFPRSFTTAQMVIKKWQDANPWPQRDAPKEKKDSYYRSLLQATDKWIQQWPDFYSPWMNRVSAVSQIEDVPAVEAEAAADGLINALKKTPGFVYGIPPVSFSAARLYLKRNVKLERIPEIVSDGIAEVEQRTLRDQKSEWLEPELKERIGENIRYARWQGWEILAETYLKSNQPGKAREVVSQMGAALTKEKPGDTARKEEKTAHANNQVGYWKWKGRLAEFERRKLDALMNYQTALSFRPKNDRQRPDEKDELADDAERLWKEMGGTDDGWQAYLSRNEAAKGVTGVAESETWDAKNQALPDFALTDMQGKLWKLADLKGKTAFINLWATWCGPCLQELPYVQKLHERMKDRKDTLVLTLNIDSELGLVEPFMKEKKYTFTVIPAQEYVESLNVYSIPRNWVVSADGVLQLEGIGYGGEGEEWLKKAIGMIEKVKNAGDTKK